MMRRIVLLAGVLVAVGLAGCGGGDGGLTTNLDSAPGESALSAFMQSSHQYTLQGSYGGSSYTLQLTNTPNAGTTTFNGFAPAYSTVQTVTISQGGTMLASDSSTIYFSIGPFQPLGSIGSGGVPYAVVASPNSLPATIRVGDSGTFASWVYYHDATQAVIDADETETYVVSANNASTLKVCLTSVISNVMYQGEQDGMAAGTETDCYAVNAAGSATLLSVAVSVNGATLTFQ